MDMEFTSRYKRVGSLHLRYISKAPVSQLMDELDEYRKVS